MSDVTVDVYYVTHMCVQLPLSGYVMNALLALHRQNALFVGVLGLPMPIIVNLVHCWKKM